MPLRLSPAKFVAILQPWAEVAEPIHRRLAQLVDAEPGQDVLWVGCGAGRSVLWWAKRFGTHVQGIDRDAKAIEAAEAAARHSQLSLLTSFQASECTNLPHEARVFDVSVANLLQLLEADGGKVVAELARVARPMSVVAALVPCWLSAPAPEDEQAMLALGLRPAMLVEWKNRFRVSGVVELVVEDTSLDGRWISPGWIGLLLRGWRAARWAGLRTVLSREFRILRALAQRRTLGLSIVKGTRWPHE
ncbi:MAG: methyltransferase domain-containing protein [Gemmatimonadales bacterium]|nr:methyltransferase domain-containing protein [Gemmatimonadales bacterium]